MSITSGATTRAHRWYSSGATRRPQRVQLGNIGIRWTIAVLFTFRPRALALLLGTRCATAGHLGKSRVHARDLGWCRLLQDACSDRYCRAMPSISSGSTSLPTDPAQARALQRELAHRVVRDDRVGTVRLIAGIDVSAGRTPIGHAAIVLLSYPDLTIVERAVASIPIPFTYVPGLLSFRELPIILPAWERLSVTPDLVLVDGQGIAHPRRLGIAAHLGLVVGVPAIGCAKSRLVGSFEEPPADAGAWTPLRDGSETIGAVVRTKRRTKPLFISTGGGLSLETAVAWVLRLCRGYRLPEPTRHAHLLAGETARDMAGGHSSTSSHT